MKTEKHRISGSDFNGTSFYRNCPKAPGLLPRTERTDEQLGQGVSARHPELFGYQKLRSKNPNAEKGINLLDPYLNWENNEFRSSAYVGSKMSKRSFGSIDEFIICLTQSQTTLGSFWFSTPPKKDIDIERPVLNHGLWVWSRSHMQGNESIINNREEMTFPFFGTHCIRESI